MADSIRAIRARYDYWKKTPTEKEWRRLFGDTNRARVEFWLSLKKKLPNARIADTDTVPELLEKVTDHLETRLAEASRIKGDLFDENRGLFDEINNLGIPDRKFDPDFAGPLWNNPSFHRSRLRDIGDSLALGNNTIPPKACAYLSRALLDIANGLPAEEALHIKNTGKPSQVIRDQWITIDYLRLIRDRRVSAEAARAEVMEAWGINSSSTVKDIVRRNRKAILSDIENDKHTAEHFGLDWDEVVDHARPGAHRMLSFDKLSELRTKYSKDI